jgi:magnesium-transporting ATPase (P-type)
MVKFIFFVCVQIIKTGQALFMQWDREMWNPVTERGLSVQNSTLNEDLGQVQKVFSDKTGTLTQNVMTFRVAIVGSCTFGSMETEIMKRVRARKAELAAELRESDAESDTGTETSNGENLKRPGMLWSQRLYAVNNPDKPVPGQSIDSILQVDESPVAAALAARAELLRILWSSPASSNESSELSSSSESVRRYLIQCAINNTVDAHIIEATGAIEYHSSSPDELALCEYAAFMGFTLIGRDPTRVRVHSFGMGPADQILEFERLATFDFNASRKRASLVYRPLSPTPSDQLLVMSKGADSAMLPLLFESASATSSPGIASPSRQSSLVHPWTGLPHLAPLLDRMADAGLRTLVLGEAVRPLTWWSDHLASEYKEVTSLSEEGDEDGHSQGSCAKTCRICSFFQEAEASAKLALLGATAIEDLLQVSL